LREKIRRLVDSHNQLLDYLDDMERQPVPPSCSACGSAARSGGFL
jgi:hypothetical protein